MSLVPTITDGDWQSVRKAIQKLSSRLGYSSTPTFAGMTLVGAITAPNFISNIAVGTSPFACTSTTLNTNLNADLLDGQEGSYYASAAGYVPYTGATTNVDLGVHNFTVDTNTLFIDSTNHRVGIGTLTPVIQCHISAGMAVGANVTSSNATRTFNVCSSNAVVRILRIHATYSAAFELMTRDTSDGANTSLWNIGSNYTDTLYFTDRIGSDVNRMVIQHTGNVGIGTDSPATSALLDLTSTDKTLLIPRLTTTQKTNLTAVNGMIVYDSTLNKFQGYENSEWTSYYKSGDSPSFAALTVSGMTTAGFVKNAVTTGLLSGGNSIALGDISGLLSGTAPVVFTAATGVFSMPAATSSVDGYMTSTFAGYLDQAVKTTSNVIFNSAIIDSTGTEALLVRKDADGGDLLIVDTTNMSVGIGMPVTGIEGLSVAKSVEGVGYGIYGSFTQTRGGSGGGYYLGAYGLYFTAVWSPTSLTGNRTQVELIGVTTNAQAVLPDNATGTVSMTITDMSCFEPKTTLFKLDAGTSGKTLTATIASSFRANNPTLLNSATVTTLCGFYDPGMTVGGTNWGWYGLSANNYFGGIVQATYFQTNTAPTANSTGADTILDRTATPAVNAGWLPVKTNAGTVVYVPYWA